MVEVEEFLENTQQYGGLFGPKKYRGSSLLKITYEDYLTMYRNQEGKCGICNRAYKVGTLTIDHDHKTNKIRGLLCYACNARMGFYDRGKVNVLRTHHVFLKRFELWARKGEL